MDAVVEDEEPVCDRPLATRIRGPVQELSVEGHRRRAPRVERARGPGAEPDHRLRQLEVRETGAVARLPAVDGDENDAAVRLLPNGGPRIAERELAAREILECPEDWLAVPDDHRAASDRVDDSTPLRPQDETRGHPLVDGSLRRKPPGRRPAGDEHRAARGNRGPAGGLDR